MLLQSNFLTHCSPISSLASASRKHNVISSASVSCIPNKGKLKFNSPTPFLHPLVSLHTLQYHSFYSFIASYMHVPHPLTCWFFLKSLLASSFMYCCSVAVSLSSEARQILERLRISLYFFSTSLLKTAMLRGAGL